MCCLHLRLEAPQQNLPLLENVGSIRVGDTYPKLFHQGLMFQGQLSEGGSQYTRHIRLGSAKTCLRMKQIFFDPWKNVAADGLVQTLGIGHTITGFDTFVPDKSDGLCEFRQGRVFLDDIHAQGHPRG
jgi:hypothetical protein